MPGLMALVCLLLASLVTVTAHRRRELVGTTPYGALDRGLCRLPGSSDHWSCPWFETITILCTASVVIGMASYWPWTLASVGAGVLWGTQARTRPRPFS